jgi:diguanylate cyclase (GGDEF)-like protein
MLSPTPNKPMKDNIRLLVMLGFVAILALMFSLAFISVVQLQTLNASMENLVKITNMKMAAANDMRDAIRMRSNSLQRMRLTTDPFERDAEQQRFFSYAGRYRVASEQLEKLGMNDREAVIHEQLQQLTRSAQPFNDMAADLLMGDAPATAIEAAMQDAAARQGLILDKLEALVRYEQENSHEALQTSRRHYSGTRNLMFALTAIAMLFSLLVARIVITRVSEKNRQLAYQATHDSLTGLTNRREFEQRVERAIEHAKSYSVTHVLMYLDLDQFKVINDTCGHAAGDKLLQQLAQLLRSSIRKRDTLSRLGGDEFGMLLENCPLHRGVAVANELLEAVNNFDFTWDNCSFRLGISVGLVPLDDSTSDIVAAMSAADSACYIAKESGRNGVQIAHLGDRRLLERHGEMQWTARLARALQKNRFTLYFQPIVPCTGDCRQHRHIEVLVRMLEEDGSIISPAAFLPAAEKYNLVTDIDRWVIENVFSWLAANSNGGNLPVTVSVNLSSQTAGSKDMLNLILAKTEETGISPEQVIFEITETAAIANIATATGFMLTLRGCGFRFALDDFGSGLSSFSYLKKLPVNFLKIDGAFVRDILCDPFDHAMVKSVNKLGHLLGMEVIAEHVETLEVAEELRILGVNYVQGYAYAKPEPLESFTRVSTPRLVVVS